MSIIGTSTSTFHSQLEIGFNLCYRFSNGQIALDGLDFSDRVTEFEFYLTPNIGVDGEYDDFLETVYINTNNIIQLEEHSGSSRSSIRSLPRTIQRIEIEFGTVESMNRFFLAFPDIEQDLHYPVYLWTTELEETEVTDIETGRTTTEPRFFSFRSYSVSYVSRLAASETVMDLSGLEDSVSEIQTETVVKPEPGMAELGRLFAKPVTTDRVVIDLTV